uniref:Uncharacterized protein n=1 Tax=Triticum urartu TaxID=4572 RepID=A0A8R7QQJ6_TRIUA
MHWPRAATSRPAVHSHVSYLRVRQVAPAATADCHGCGQSELLLVGDLVQTLHWLKTQWLSAPQRPTWSAQSRKTDPSHCRSPSPCVVRRWSGWAPPRRPSVCCPWKPAPPPIPFSTRTARTLLHQN